MYKSLILAAIAILLSGCEKTDHHHEKHEKHAKEVNVSEMLLTDEDQSDNAKNKDFAQHLGSDRVSFGFDQYGLSKEDKKFLDQVVEYLIVNIDLRVEVQGNCDIRGSKDYNIGLGERRANAVAEYLNKKGIAEERLSVVSFGARVLFPGDTEEVYAKNRVGIIVTK